MEDQWCPRARTAGCSTGTEMNIDQIQVGFRYRKDLGDLRSLADSIVEVGLLHPVVVTPEGRLIAGQRRLEACRLLDWTDVPVTAVDLYQAARGEAHENFVRKDLLPSEIVALKRAIEPLERREARQRQGYKETALCPSATVAEGQRACPEPLGIRSLVTWASARQPSTAPRRWLRRPRKTRRSTDIWSSRWIAPAKWPARIGGLRF